MTGHPFKDGGTALAFLGDRSKALASIGEGRLMLVSPVQREDAHLLKMEGYRACCGGRGTAPLFWGWKDVTLSPG